MYSSSSSAYRGDFSSSASRSGSRRDERLSNAPLTTERAMMEQIRAKLERTQRRMAREGAAATSQSGYNSRHAAPMSVSSRHHHHHHSSSSSSQYQSSSSQYHSARQTQSRSTHHHHLASAPRSRAYPGSSAHYFPAEPPSGRAPTVQPVYLEDLPQTILSSQSIAASTSYAPGSVGGVPAPPPSTAASYYAPPLDEPPSQRVTRYDERRERAPTLHASVRSERHAVHESHHHHHHHSDAQASVPSSHRHRHVESRRRGHPQPQPQRDAERPRDHAATPTEVTSHHSGRRGHHHHHHQAPTEAKASHRKPVVAPPPPSSRGILRRPSAAPLSASGGDAPPSSSFVSSNFIVYASSHGAVPLSSAPFKPPPSSSSSSSVYHTGKQPLASNGQPERSALKQNTLDDGGDDPSHAEVVVAPPPSSRVRFLDELQQLSAYPALVEEDEDADDSQSDDGGGAQLQFLGEELPYDPEEDYAVDDDDDDDFVDYEQYVLSSGLEPILEIRETRLAEPEAATAANHKAPDAVGSPVAGAVLRKSAPPPSPEPTRKTRSNSDKDAAVDADAPPAHRRRRGSSAARTPPNVSPSTSHARKSLSSLEPPKSAIDVSYFDQFDMRTRRASKEKRSSNASADTDHDALAASDVVDAQLQQPPSPAAAAVGSSASSERDFGSEQLVKLSSSPIDVHLYSPPKSNGSLHESDLAFDEPAMSPLRLVARRASVGRGGDDDGNDDGDKPSPSSSDDYCDARAFSDDESADALDARSGSQRETHKHAGTTATGGGAGGDDGPVGETDGGAPPLPPKSVYKNFWELTDSDDSDEAENEPEPHAMPTPRPGGDHRVAAANTEIQPVDAATTDAPPTASLPPRPASSVAAAMAPPPRRVNRQPAPSQRTASKPMPLSQSLMMLAPPPSTTRASHRPPPLSTHIRPSPATARASLTRSQHLDRSLGSSATAVSRAPATLDVAASYVRRSLRSKTSVMQLRKALPPSIGALSGLASGPVTFELNVDSFYEVLWQTGEFGFSFQRVYVEDEDEEDDGCASPSRRQMFLRMLLNTERGTCASFREVRVGDVLIEIGNTRVCDLSLDKHGGGAALTKYFTELRNQTPLRLVFQRMDPTTWEGGVEL